MLRDERQPNERMGRNRMTDVVRVLEVIHHGDFQHLTALNGGSLTEALKHVLDHSPYPSVHRDEPEWVAALWEELLDEGEASRGWCRYSWTWVE
ncbi:hypothetical protein [Xylanimonas sp. McL0601]|uniref:hypothetical protein n=1 Tax=Xylanimonas sp. McL0601 TaxID=3414739 RepID=UPI003CE77654